jgi:diguanylate cyclase
MEELLHEPYRYLRLALPLMTKLNVPVTPENYMVWYRYVSGWDTSLSRAIDAYVRDGAPFSSERNEELYRRFCRNEGDEELVEEIRSSLKRIFGTVATELTVLAGQAAEYESFVSSTIDKLSDNPSAADIRNAAEGIINATKTLGECGRSLRLQLDETTESFDVLKKKFVQAKKESLIDFLTGIPNRRYFDGTLTSMVHGVAGGGWSILLVDIDHFKDFNDRYGHLTGDNVLRLVAKMIKKNVKGKDIVCRFGGEEFAVILPETLLEGALSVAENVRRYFSKKSLRAVSEAKDLGVLTVSIGAACFCPGESSEDLLRRADSALYHAKNAGRNRVTSAV